MNRNPEYVEIEGKKYKINTDFRYAIECNRIAEDETIGDTERALAIIYVLFGEEGIDSQEHHEKLLRMAKKYLSCGKGLEETNEKPDMDYIEDYDYIETSFMSDYGINLDNVEIHWWKFNNLMNGLSNSEMGNCCILNRIRNLRNFDLREIKDPKERQKIKKAQEEVALRKYNKKHTSQQRESVNSLLEQLGIKEE
jgi:hypothetical protein